MRAIALMLVAAGGCFVQATGGARFHGASLRGGELGGALGGDAARLNADLAVYGSGPGDRLTAELDTTLAVSPLGWVRGEREAAPWVDVGGLLGYGLGVTGDGGYISGLFGGYLDVRLARDDRSYPALHVTAVREIYTDHAPDATVFVFGLAWTIRDPDFNFHIDG